MKPSCRRCARIVSACWRCSTSLPATACITLAFDGRTGKGRQGGAIGSFQAPAQGSPLGLFYGLPSKENGIDIEVWRIVTTALPRVSRTGTARQLMR